MADGLVMNTLQRLNLQQEVQEGRKVSAGCHSSLPEGNVEMAGSKIWQCYEQRLAEFSPFLGVTFQTMGEMMLRNEKR